MTKIFFLLVGVYVVASLNEFICNQDGSNIPIIDSDSLRSDFEFNNFNKPFIVNSQKSNWYSNAEFFKPSNLMQEFGDFQFEYSDPMDLALPVKNSNIQKVKLKAYSDKKKYQEKLIYDKRFISMNADKIGLKSLDLLNQISDINNDHKSSIFAMGKSKTGIAWTCTDNMLLQQIYGKTKIFLYPPQYWPVGGALTWNGYTPKEWNDIIYPRLSEDIIDSNINPDTPLIRDIDRKEIVYKTNVTSIDDIFNITDKQKLFIPFKPFECILSPNQMLFIPHKWWYSMLNINNSIHIITEMDNKFNKERCFYRRAYNDPIRSYVEAFKYFYSYNDKESGRQYFEKSLLIDPTAVDTYVRMVDIFMQTARFNQQHQYVVERFLKIAYALNPHHELVRSTLANLFDQNGYTGLAQLVRGKQPL